MLRWIIRVGVSGAVVAILLAIIPVDSVIDALRRTSPWTWSASVAIFFAGHYLNALKLRLLLGGAAPGLTSACVRAQYAGLVANLGLPGLAGGDLVRAAYVTPLVGVTRAASAGIADRVIDTGTVLVLVFIALPLAGIPPGIASVLRDGGWWLVALALPVLVAGLLVWQLQRSGRTASAIAGAWTALLSRRSALMGAVAISLVVQSAFVMTNVWLARQVGVTTELPAWFVAWPSQN